MLKHLPPHGLSALRLIVNGCGDGVDEGVALGLEVAEEGAEVLRALDLAGEEGFELVKGEDGVEGGGLEEVVCEDLFFCGGHGDGCWLMKLKLKLDA